MSASWIPPLHTFYRVLVHTNGAKYAIEHQMLKHARTAVAAFQKDRKKCELYCVQVRYTMHQRKVTATRIPLRKPCRTKKKSTSRRK